MKAQTLQGDSLGVINQKLSQILTSDFQPTIAITFTSPTQDITGLQTLFNKHNIDVLGSTSASEFMDDTVYDKSIVVMLLDLPKDAYTTYFAEAEYQDSYIASEQLAHYGKTNIASPAFIIVFTMTCNGEEIIRAIKDNVSMNTKIFGGMAGDDAMMKASYVFNNTLISKKAFLGLIIDQEKIQVNGLAVSGWESLGTINTITSAKGNIIETINDEPALDVFVKFCGSYHHFSEEDGTVAIASAQYPLQILRGDSHVLRAVLNADEQNRTLWTAGPVKTGEKFKFSIAPGFEIIEETLQKFSDFQEMNNDADAVLAFSCKARHFSLGPLIEEEIEGIYNLWKKPFIGFFTYGEIGQEKMGASYFYNETCSLVTLTEK